MNIIMPRLQPFGDDIWIMDGPTVDFYSFPYPTRSVLVRLASGGLWLWSPIAVDDELIAEVKALGTIEVMVSPNKIHWLFMQQWQEIFPDAEVWASPGLAKRPVASGIRFTGTLGQQPEPSYAKDIDQVVFETGVMDEVVFYHRRSQTLIVGDLMERLYPVDGWRGWLLERAGVSGIKGKAPPDLRCIYIVGGHLPMARQRLDRILYEWQPDKLIVAHGEITKSGALPEIAEAFDWIPEHPRPRQACGCGCFGNGSAPSGLEA